jgi:hypothetical protein
MVASKAQNGAATDIWAAKLQTENSNKRKIKVK